MNTPVSLEVKQLLFNKGWRYELGPDETGHRVKHSLAEERWNQGHLNYVDITIAEVVMWLYEKHGIWIEVTTDVYGKFCWLVKELKASKNNFNSPTEAYEAAILYTFNNLI